MAKRPSFLQYANNEVPPPASIAILAIQHSAIILINLVYVIVITKSLNLSASDEFAMLSTTLLVCGAVTALQAKFASGLLIVFHPNPIYIPLIIAAGVTDGLSGVAFLLLCAGLVHFFFGSVVRKLRVFFPPEVCGVVVIMLGVSLLPSALRGVVTQSLEKTFLHLEASGLAVALVTLAIAAAGSVWLKGMARFMSLLLGCLTGMIMAWALGIWEFGSVKVGLSDQNFALPSIHLPGITFSAGLIYLAVVAALVNVVDELGVLISTERLDDAEWQVPKFTKLSLGLQASGLATAISGLLGGVAMGMSSANLSLAYATGVSSRVIGIAVGCILVSVTFMPVVLKHVMSLPDAVVAGILFYAACYFIVSGAELALSRMLSARRSLVIGLSVGAGILLQSAPTLTTRFAGTSLEHVLAPMTFATIIAIVLNIVMRIGIRQKETVTFAGDDDVAKASDLLESLGERWGLPRQVVSRANAAMIETLELINLQAEGPVDCTIAYNELLLTMSFSYKGQPFALPTKAPTADDLNNGTEGLAMMGGWIVQKLADLTRVSSSEGKQQLLVAFEC